VSQYAGITRIIRMALLVIGLAAAGASHAERLKDLVSIQGVRENQLVGYGLVVGLDGSGDQTTQTPFTVRSILNMLEQMGVTLPATAGNLQLKNVAAVMITASLPPFAQPGQAIDVTVSSIGNARSLRGGTLLMTPLKGADGQVYAMAQGNLIVGGVGAAAGGSRVQVNHLSVGRISNRATVERAVPTALGDGGTIMLELRQADFSTASEIVKAINHKFGNNTASALDGRVIRVSAPQSPNVRVAFLGQLENIEVNPGIGMAKVVLNARTGSVVMNQMVTLQPFAISHGNLSIVIDTDNAVSQPNMLGGGTTMAVPNAQIEVKKEPGAVLNVKNATSLADVVKALNSIGATPQDLLAILQAMKASGALRAELEVI